MTSIQGKKFEKVPKSKTWSGLKLATMSIIFIFILCIYNYLQSVYIILDNVSDLGMTESIGKMCLGRLEHLWILYPWSVGGFLNQSSVDAKG